MAQGDLGTLRVNIEANLRQFRARMQEIQTTLQNSQKKMKSIGEKMSKNLSLPLLGFATLSIKTFADFEKAMSEVEAISGATGKQLDQLTTKAKEMGSTTKFSAVQSAEAMKFMAMAGWDTTQILNGLSGVMNLASASGEELAVVSDILTDAMTAFKLETSESSRFADILAAATSGANTNVAMLGESFKFVAPVAGAFKMSAEDSAFALSVMANAGIKASQSGTTLRGILARILTPTKNSKEAIETLGLSAINADGSIKSLSEILTQIRSGMSKLTPEQQALTSSQLAGQEALSGLLSIVSISDKEYNKLTDAIENSNGVAEKMSKIMGDNLAGKLIKLKSALEGVAITIGEILAPFITISINLLQKLINAFNELSPTTKKIIVLVSGLVATLGPLILGISTIVAFLGAFSAAIVTVGGVVLGLTVIIGGLIGIGWTLYKNWEDIKSNMEIIFLALQLVFVEIINKIAQLFAVVARGIIGDIKKIGNVIGIVFPSIKKLTNDLSTKFESMNAKFTQKNIQTQIELTNKINEKSILIQKRKTKELEQSKKTEEEMTEKNKKFKKGISETSKVLEDTTISIGQNEEAIQDLGDAYDDTRAKIVDAFDDMGSGITNALENMYNKQLNLEEKAINKSINLVKRESSLKISEYNKVFMAKSKILDEETRKSISKIENQIQKINKQTDEEEKQLEKQAHDKEKAERIKAIAEEQSTERRAKLQIDFNDFLLKRERKLLLESRRNQVDLLRDEMTNIKNQSIEKKKQLELEFETQKANEEAIAKRKTNHFISELSKAKYFHKERIKEENLEAEARKIIINNNQDEIVKLIESYYPRWKNAGKTLGENLLEGLSGVESIIQHKMTNILGSVNGIIKKARSTTTKVPAFTNQPSTLSNNLNHSNLEKRSNGGVIVNVTGNTISGQREADKMASTIVRRLRTAGVNP